jgi:proton-dependent oligopeptide transporter, POT family
MTIRSTLSGPNNFVAVAWRSTVGAHPKGLMTLFMTEFWERFSFYGMKAFLLFYIVHSVSEGALGLPDKTGTAILGSYGMFVYLLAIPGGFIADRFLGAWLGVLVGGVMIAMGHFSLAFHSIPFFYTGLGLICVGTGLLKPNVSTMVGGLYGENDPRRDSGFSLFYMGINSGAFVGPLVAGYLAQGGGFKRFLAARGLDPNSSWHYGFAAAGIGMLLGLTQYLLNSKRLAVIGRRPDKGALEKSAPVPVTAPGGSVRQEESIVSVVAPEAAPGDQPILVAHSTATAQAGHFAGSGLTSARSAGRSAAIVASAVLVLAGLPTFAHGLWRGDALEQVAGILMVSAGAVWGFALSRGVLRTDDWRRVAVIAILFLFAWLFWTGYEQAATSLSLFADRLTRNQVFSFSFPASWFQSVQALFVIILAPVFSVIWLKLGKYEPSSPAKFAYGLFFLGLSFLLLVPASRLSASGKVSPWWLVGVYFIQVVGELCVSPVGLSTVTKLAHVKIVGIMMGVWFLSISLGDKMAGYLGGFFDATRTDILANLFGYFGIVVLAATLILALMIPRIRKLMGGVH